MFTAKESLSVTAVYKQKKINLLSVAQCTVSFNCLLQCSFAVMTTFSQEHIEKLLPNI